MSNILHITADYPDVFFPRKTQAVKNLLELPGRFNHIIYSMNRINGLGGIEKHLDSENNVTSFKYGAPPLGLFQETFLNPVADWIFEDIKKRTIPVDVIHAHKMTVEGVIARRLAEKLGCPYICSLWGNTDQKFIRSKPEKRALYKKVAEDSAVLLPASPWIKDYTVEKLGLHPSRFTELPVITQSNAYYQSAKSDRGFVSAFNLDTYRLKGTVRLLEAISLVLKAGEDVKLTIYGGGSEKSVAAVNELIAKQKLQDHVTLGGPVPHEEIQEVFNQYQAFVLPTLRESYGMVFIEALFSGVPILYSKNRGIDGYFYDVEVGYCCDPHSAKNIAHGLTYLSSIEEQLKANISELQQNGFFEKFRKHEILQIYSDTLHAVMNA